MINFLKKILKRAEVDRAVFFGILTKSWSLLAGPVSAILIATNFTPEIQGFYYTFASIVALQVFMEMGLGTVIIQFASHEWSHLGFDESGQVIGDSNALSRLVSLAGVTFKWYLILSIIVIFGLGIGGYYFLNIKTTVQWVFPWFFLCFLTGLTIITVPMWSILEGCNQVSNIYMYRFIQALCITVSIWIAILAGANLWVASISSLVGLLCTVILLWKNYRNFLKKLFFSQPTGLKIKWKAEILPMQWRIALSWMMGYLMFSMFTPVLFHFHGPTLAGKMGLTWSLVSVISSISFAWISPRAPKLGMLIAQRNFIELDQFFWKLTKIITVIAILVASIIVCFVYFLYSQEIFLAERILPPVPTAIFALASIVLSISLPFSTYLRAHKKEPLLTISIISGILICISNIISGKYYGVTGMATGYLIITLLMLPFVVLIWQRCKSEWHS